MAAPRTRFLSASVIFLVLSLLGIVIGAVLRWGAHEPDAANLVWGITTAIGLVPIAWEVLSGIVRRRPGVLLLVKHGEVVPVDGLLSSGNGALEESAFTGGSWPVESVHGARILRG